MEGFCLQPQRLIGSGNSTKTKQKNLYRTMKFSGTALGHLCPYWGRVFFFFPLYRERSCIYR